MNRVLLVDIDKRLIDLYSLNVKTFLNVEMEVKETGAMAINYMSSDQNIDLIITRVAIGKEKTLEKICEMMVEYGFSVPIIALGKKDPLVVKKFEQFTIKFLDQVKEIDRLIKGVGAILEIDPVDVENFEIEDYYPIPIAHFYVMKASICPVFLKMGKGNSVRFLKRIHEGENLGKEVLNRYVTSGANELFVESENRQSFVTAISQELLKMVGSDNSGVSAKARQLSQEVVTQNIKELGITPEIVALSESAIKSMNKVLAKVPKLNKLLEKLYANENSFAYKHTHLTTYIGHQILQHMDWAKDAQKNTFSFVAFFNDISLEEDRLIKVVSNNQLKSPPFNADELELLKTHAQVSAELTLKFPQAPMGADAIIRQHHGAMNGVGYSEHFSGNLSPLAVVFMLAEAASYFMLTKRSNEVNKETVVKHLTEKFPTSRIKKMIDVIADVF